MISTLKNNAASGYQGPVKIELLKGAGLLFLCSFSLFFFQTLFSLGASLVDCLSFFTFLRFGTAASVTGFFVCHYAYILELVGPSYRTMGAKVMDFFWVTGAAVMTLLAYLIRDWRSLLLVASFLPVLVLLLWTYVLSLFFFT